MNYKGMIFVQTKWSDDGNFLSKKNSKIKALNFSLDSVNKSMNITYLFGEILCGHTERP